MCMHFYLYVAFLVINKCTGEFTKKFESKVCIYDVYSLSLSIVRYLFRRQTLTFLLYLHSEETKIDKAYEKKANTVTEMFKNLALA